MGAMERRVEDWQSIHVHYQSENKDGLILDGVRPFFAEVAGVATGMSYVRHWRQGPHVRLHMRADEQTMATTVLPTAERVLGSYLEKHPSTEQLDPQRSVALHQRLAELEEESGPLLPWYPDNSLHPAPFVPRDAALGGRGAAELLMDFHASATKTSFDMIRRCAIESARLTMAFDLMVATAHFFADSGITRGFLSFRSHAEAFLCRWPETAGLRERWEANYAAGAAAVEKRLATVLSDVDAGRGVVPFVLPWIELLSVYRDRAAAMQADGIRVVPVVSSLQSEQMSGPSLTSVSPFHRALETNAHWEQMQHSDAFGRYRLMLNLTYLQLTRLGLNPIQRFMLCHFVANAAERSYGISAMKLVKSSTRTAM